MPGNIMRKWTPDGVISRVWAEVMGNREGVPDGIKIHSEGNLCTAGPGDIHFFAPDATSLGIIYMPEGAANFTWGEADLLNMLVTASTSLYRVRVIVPGATASQG